jgi:RHS repeat-associated protein
VVRYYTTTILTELQKLSIPKNGQNKVEYSYGAPSDTLGRAGRISLIQDASGGQEFFYGRLGEIVKTIRTVIMGESDMRTWIWSAKYDSWNRVENMIYPDGEIVFYKYNKGGNLYCVQGEKLGRKYDYISRIGYDKNDKQKYLQYGNGDVTTFDYEQDRLRLKKMSLNANGKNILSNEYSYSLTNSIKSVVNNIPASGKIGGKTTHSFNYDELNRLTNATGSFEGNDNNKSDFSLSLSYDALGNILSKNQELKKGDETQPASTYDMKYQYESDKPNAASEIGQRKCRYDYDGNLTLWEDTVTNDFRQFIWDEENRISLISDNGYLNRNVYDALGERVIKSHGGSQGIYINGAPSGLMNHSDENYTVYVSPYFTFKDNKFTKHYYFGSTRIASKLGEGQFNNQFFPAIFGLSAGGIDYITRQQKIAQNKEEHIAQMHIPPGPPTLKGIYGDPEFSGTAFLDTSSSDSPVPKGWPKKPVFAPAGGPPGAPVQWGKEITNVTVPAGFGYVGTGNIKETLVYFYHPDYTGNSNYITDYKGDIAQYLAYMPSGEIFVDDHTKWESTFKFNARELDSETGLYYYGSRFYDPKTNLWLGTNPKAEIYPFVSPYVFGVEDENRNTDMDNIIDDGINYNKLSSITSDKSINMNFGFGNFSSLSANAASSPDVTNFIEWFTEKDTRLYFKNEYYYNRADKKYNALKTKAEEIQKTKNEAEAKIEKYRKEGPQTKAKLLKQKSIVEKSEEELDKIELKMKSRESERTNYKKKMDLYLKRINNEGKENKMNQKHDLNSKNKNNSGQKGTRV